MNKKLSFRLKYLQQWSYFQHFKVYLNFIFHTVSSFQQSHSIRCSMQKKENKGSQTENCSYIPTQTKKNPSPSEKVALTN